MKVPVLSALALAVSLVAPLVASATPAATPEWTPAMRAQVLTSAEKELGNYFFTDKIAVLRGALEAHRSGLLQIADPQKFSDAVTKDLQAVSHDKHLALWYLPIAAPLVSAKPTAADIERINAGAHYLDYGYQGTLRLHGNVGYLNLSGFFDMPQVRPTIDSAMALVAHTDALIIDLRDNNGGDPTAVDYLLGYFFAKRVEVTGFVWKHNGTITGEPRFSASVTGARYLNRPVYLLINNATISGGEQFAYDMKTLHRAQLIGATTAGAANPGDALYINDHFRIFVPNGIARSPSTGTSWEGVGISPDVAIAPKRALLEAYTRALRAADNSFPGAVAGRDAALKNPAAALNESLPEH